MRKFSLLITSIFLGIILYGQVEYPKNSKGEIEFRDSVSVKLTKNQLFPNFKKWIVLEFKNTKDAILFEDYDSGIEIAKLRITGGHTQINSKDISTDISLMISVKCKDNQYNFTIKNVEIHAKIFEVGGGVPRFYNDTPYRHFRHIEEYNTKIMEIQSAGELSSRDRRNIAVFMSEIQREKDLFESEYKSLMKCIEVFKNYMIKTDL